METDFPGAIPDYDLRHSSSRGNGWQGGTYFTVSGLGQQLFYIDQFDSESGNVHPLGFGGLNGHGSSVRHTTARAESAQHIDNHQAYREQPFGLAEVSVLIDNLGAYTSYLGVEDGDILLEELLDADLDGTHWIDKVVTHPGHYVAGGGPVPDIVKVDVESVINNTGGFLSSEGRDLAEAAGLLTVGDDLTYRDLEYVGSGVNEDFDGEGNSKGFNFAEYLFGSDEKNAQGETWEGIIETRTDPSGVESFYLGDLDISVETNQTLDGLYTAENRPNTTRFSPGSWTRTPVEAWVPQNQKDMNNIIMAWFYELMGNYLPAYNQMMVNYHDAHGGLVLGTDYPSFDQWIELGFGPESPDLAGMSPLQAASAAKDYEERLVPLYNQYIKDEFLIIPPTPASYTGGPFAGGGLVGYEEGGRSRWVEDSAPRGVASLDPGVLDLLMSSTLSGPGGFAHGGYVGGMGGGLDDSVPAVTDGSELAQLSSGEFVIPADVVSHLGDGNNENGASKLYDMMERARVQKTGQTFQPAMLPDEMIFPV